MAETKGKEMNWFDRQVEENHKAGISAGIVFFFVRKSSGNTYNSTKPGVSVMKATHGTSMNIEIQKILDRYSDLSKTYEQYEFVEWPLGQQLFPILRLKESNDDRQI